MQAKQEINTSDCLARTWWKHTPKGVRRGCWETRIFAVVGTVQDEGREFLLAWKCEDLGDGRIWHPAYGEVNAADVDPFVLTAENGADPTAMFRPGDSLYTMRV